MDEVKNIYSITEGGVTTSIEVNELFAAFVKAQGAFRKAVKDTVHPFLKHKYANFSTVVDSCREELDKHNLGFIQSMQSQDSKIIVTTRIIHASGQWIQSSVSWIPSKADIQSAGAVTTYLKRYALSAMLGIAVADEDDDGESDRSHRAIANKEQQLDLERVFANPALATYKETLFNHFKINSISAIPAENYAAILSKANTLLKAAAE